MDYPSNSNRQHKGEGSEPEPKKVERIVSGKVIRRKKPLGKRFTSFFGAGNFTGVAAAIFTDVLIPAMKDAVADTFSQGIERLMYGETRSASRRGVYRGGQNYGHTQYNRPGGGLLGSARREDPRVAPNRRARANHNFDDIILPTRAEADEVIDRLFDLIQRYEFASVKDLYEMVGEVPEYTDDKWGWDDPGFRGAGVSRVRGGGGYVLELPKPEPIQ